MSEVGERRGRTLDLKISGSSVFSKQAPQTLSTVSTHPNCCHVDVSRDEKKRPGSTVLTAGAASNRPAVWRATSA
jgi:hypothetical protein